MRPKSLKFKIALSTSICIFIVGAIGNALLYRYLTGIIFSKADHIDNLYVETIKDQIDSAMADFHNIANISASDIDVSRAMRHENLNLLTAKKDAARAQETLKAYINGSKKIGDYIDKMIIFNEHGLSVQGVTRKTSLMTDVDKIKELNIFYEITNSSEKYIMKMSPSICPENLGRPVLSIIWRLNDYHASLAESWVYMELSPDYIEELLKSYTQITLVVTENNGKESTFFAGAEDGKIIRDFPDKIPKEGFENIYQTSKVKGETGEVYTIRSLPIQFPNLYLSSGTDVTFLAKDEMQLVYTSIILAVSCLVVAVVLSIILSNIITRPLERLVKRLRKVSKNDFSYDPEIEKSNDEIGEVGAVVNEMTGSLSNLIEQTQEMYEHKKNAEIQILQSQVNPHFLYNTLDSICWMATIQKNKGISEMTKGLSSLLKNLAKGVGDKISLRKELELLDDYIKIQAIRYFETFEVIKNVDERFLDYSIIKFTLQPLIENAIFHGIEPTGKFGKITISVEDDEGGLYVIVEDDGVGMTEEEVADLFENQTKPNPERFSGIGVSNVHNRLRLVYGKPYGLSYESEKGKYTRAIVYIPKEGNDVQGTISG